MEVVEHETYVSPELRDFLNELPKALVGISAENTLERSIEYLQNEIERVEALLKIRANIEGIRIRLEQQLSKTKSNLLKVEETLKLSVAMLEPKDFTVSQVVEALYTVVHRNKIFLKGKMRTNFSGSDSKIVGREDMIPHTITEIQCKDGVLCIGLSKEEAALSFVSDVDFELEFD